MQAKMLPGWGELVSRRGAGEKQVRVYEALEPLTCRVCQRPMIPGKRFTRHRAACVICWFSRVFVDPEDDREDIGIAATGNRPLLWRPRPESIRHASQDQLWTLWKRLRGVPND
jgi:hypothetical protein